MAIFKILLTALVAVALSVSTASAQENSMSKKRAEVMSKRSIQAIKPMSNLQNQQQKRVFNSVVLSHVPVERHEITEKFPCGSQYSGLKRLSYTLW